MTSASDEKWQTFNCFFQSRKHVVVRRGQIQRIRWVVKTLEAQVGQFLLGCQCPVSRGIVVQEQDQIGDLPAAFFLQNVLQLHLQRWVLLGVDSLALRKIINEEDVVLIPKNRSPEMPSCSAIHLAEIRWPSKISSWILTIISGVVTVLGRPGLGALPVEKSPRLNWAT